METESKALYQPQARVIKAIDRAVELLEPLVIDQEASLLHRYIPTVREHDPKLELFAVQRGLTLNPEDLSHTSFQVSAVQGGVHSLRGEGMMLWAFIRAVSALTNLVEQDEAIYVAQLLVGIVEQIEEQQRFPALDGRYVEDYVACLEAILGNEEPSTRGSLFSYNLGVWWFMGHLRQVDQVRLKARGWRGPTVRQFVRDVWLERIARGVLDEY